MHDYLIEHNLYQTKNILDYAREAILLGSFNNYIDFLPDDKYYIP